MRFFITLFLVVICNVMFAQNCDNTIHEGEGTYYASIAGTSSGNCSLPIASTDFMYAALNTPDYNGSDACGACIEVTGPKGKVVLRVVDRCPECKEGDVDLSEPAFAQIADVIDGRVPITWKYVPCDRQNKNIKINFKEGSSQYWTAIQFRDIKFGIEKMEYKTTSDTWKPVDRVLFNFFIEENGIKPPMDLRITSTNGEQLIFEDIPIDLDIDYDTGQQFVKDADCSLSTANNASTKSKTVLYPNPAKTFFFINTSQKIKFELFNTKGALVRSGNVASGRQAILVDSLPRGLYYVSINNTMKPLILR